MQAGGQGAALEPAPSWHSALCKRAERDCIEGELGIAGLREAAEAAMQFPPPGRRPCRRSPLHRSHSQTPPSTLSIQLPRQVFPNIHAPGHTCLLKIAACSDPSGQVGTLRCIMARGQLYGPPSSVVCHFMRCGAFGAQSTRQEMMPRPNIKRCLSTAPGAAGRAGYPRACALPALVLGPAITLRSLPLRRPPQRPSAALTRCSSRPRGAWHSAGCARRARRLRLCAPRLSDVFQH